MRYLLIQYLTEIIYKEWKIGIFAMSAPHSPLYHYSLPGPFHTPKLIINSNEARSTPTLGLSLYAGCGFKTATSI
jgi:hypothetical protein